MMGGTAKWHVFLPNEGFLVAKSALGPHGANPPHTHMTQEKPAYFSKQGLQENPAIFSKQGFSMKLELDWV